MRKQKQGSSWWWWSKRLTSDLTLEGRNAQLTRFCRWKYSAKQVKWIKMPQSFLSSSWKHDQLSETPIVLFRVFPKPISGLFISHPTSQKICTTESTCNAVITRANEQLVYFGPGKMPFIKFMNAVKSLLPCLLKSLWKCYLWVQLTVLNLMWLLINGNKINYVTTKHSKESKLLPAERTFISIRDFTYIKKLKRKHKLWPEKWEP